MKKFLNILLIAIMVAVLGYSGYMSLNSEPTLPGGTGGVSSVTGGTTNTSSPSNSNTNISSSVIEDYQTLKEEIISRKAEIFTVPDNSYVEGYADVYLDADTFLTEADNRHVYSSYINVNEDTVAVLAGGTTLLPNDLRFDDYISDCYEWIFIITRYELVDVYFETNTVNYSLTEESITEGAIKDYGLGHIYNIGYSLGEIMPAECVSNLIKDSEETGEEGKEFNMYCLTLGAFHRELKDGIEESEYGEVEDYDVLQLLELTFVKEAAEQKITVKDEAEIIEDDDTHWFSLV